MHIAKPFPVGTATGSQRLPADFETLSDGDQDPQARQVASIGQSDDVDRRALGGKFQAWLHMN
eukprot:4004089-Pyramimonas_sp.AAC.1